MNIVLIGYRGTGKSCVAKILSRLLYWPVFHMDDEIVARAGKSIHQIVARNGWNYFRDLESEAVQEACARDQLIVDTGGGVILLEKNVQSLRQNSVVIWLKALPEIIARRIKGDTERPSLTGEKSFLEEIEEVLSERTPRYQAAADHEINTDRLSPEQVAEKILALVEEAMKRVTSELE